MVREILENQQTKHQQIIEFIKDLSVDTKVSVRQIARELNVSEGTAYRAIKEAEKRGLVSSIPKVGTIRIPEQQTRQINSLTLQEIALIVEGDVLTGRQDLLESTPTRFLLGCNTSAVISRYLEKNTLLIVGDLIDLQRLALKKEAHLMITGAFKVPDEILNTAKAQNLVVISCPFDAFEAVSLMDKAINERLTNKELVRVDDIMVKKVYYLTVDDTVESWYRLSLASGHSRFPVIDQDRNVLGIVTAVDVAGVDRNVSIGSVMSKDVLKVEKHTLVSHLSRILFWEGYELVPIVKDTRLIGVVSRQDILMAFQQLQKQPHVGETMDNLVMSGLTLNKWENGIKLSGKVSQWMINEEGTASPGVLVTMMSSAACIAVRSQLRLEAMVEHLTLHHLESVAVGEEVDIYAQIIHLSKKICLVDINLYVNKNLKAKSAVQVKYLKKKQVKDWYSQ